MLKTVYRLKKFRLTEISLVDRPACDIATVERVELAKRNRSESSWASKQGDPKSTDSALNQVIEEQKSAMKSREINDLQDSDFAYIEPGGTKDAEGKTTPRGLRHFPIHDAEHVRNALARLGQSKFGAAAAARVHAAAKAFGIDDSSEIDHRRSRSDANMGQEKTKVIADSVSADAKTSPAQIPGLEGVTAARQDDPKPVHQTESVPNLDNLSETIGGDASLAGSNGLIGTAERCAGSYTLAPGEVKKYIPLQALPIVEKGNGNTSATSLAGAIADEAIDEEVPELCELFLQVVANILGSNEISDKRSALLTAADDLKTALGRIDCDSQLSKTLAQNELRTLLLKADRAISVGARKNALVKALRQLKFAWPDGAAAIRLLGAKDRVMGSITQSEFQKPTTPVGLAARSDLHTARDLLISLCASSGCAQDSALQAYLESIAANPEAETALIPPGAREVTNTASSATFDKMIESLLQTAKTVSTATDEMRKVAEASVGTIRKAEGSAKVLSLLAERVARLEAQPDNLAPQPLRTVEKGTPFNFGSSLDDSNLRIAVLQQEAMELRKRSGDQVAQKRLSEIGVEIIRLSNGIDPAASVFRAATGR